MQLVGDTGGKRALIDRVLASATFGKSPRLLEFLRYVTERELLGRPEEIKESLIEREVFRRDRPGGDGDAAVVRVTARQLRLKLAQYFVDEGAHEPIILEIPKGGYQPVFRTRDAVLAGPSAAPPALPIAGWRGRFWIGPAWLLAGVLLGLALAQMFLVRREMPSTTPTLFRRLLLDRPGRTYLVTSDAGLFLRQKMWSTSIGLQEFMKEVPAPRGSDELSRALWDQLSRYSYTSFADLSTVAGIYAAHPDAIGRISTRESRSLHARDFGSDNFLIIGSEMANPWVALFRQRLSFFVDYDLAAQRPFVMSRDLSTGLMGHLGAAGPGISYGHLACLGTGQGSGYAVLISGTTQAAREAVGDLLCDRNPPPDLVLPHTHVSDWEALLSVETLQGVPRKLRILEYRAILAAPIDKKTAPKLP